ncbi:DUF6160 family protein [Pseudomonas citronellolis]|uniref:DUF6160 family protein n=1 Tax=Pseudomonas citronellolis TaxID=53408 RepID=UPI0020A1F8F3|nr:DUF6160 family protein [Pseudomonas citronellolis]MCP1602663.1 hypothetical protein [Pseudomonas citronellolis]MCP1653721.1 hypothetical protein [Pseudomonas citronellolis]MCP1720666.1 hypothetical protein [Pseudomonas citronellolis]
MTFLSVRRLLLASVLLCLAGGANAELRALSDSQLSDVTGQAFINLATDAAAGINYTRLNIGATVETQLNMNKLQLGLYDRAGEAANSADISINNFALGTVNNQTGQINPFTIVDPYVEFAYDGNKMVGVRIGFNQAKGVLSGDIQSLTGNIPVHIKGTADAIYNKATVGQQLLLGLAGIYRSSTVEADAGLVTSGGASDPVRGTYAGMTNGSQLDCTNGCVPLWTDIVTGLFTSNNCAILGITTCFKLSQFQSLPVGDLSQAGLAGAAKGFFISLQSQDVQWRDMDTGQMITALKGAFMNMPKYRDANGNLVSPINIDFNQAFNGIPRQDTCVGMNKGC